MFFYFPTLEKNAYFHYTIKIWARSSVVEHSPYKRVVTGSIPVVPNLNWFYLEIVKIKISYPHFFYCFLKIVV